MERTAIAHPTTNIALPTINPSSSTVSRESTEDQPVISHSPAAPNTGNSTKPTSANDGNSGPACVTSSFHIQ
jgi:hypothetical protein